MLSKETISIIKSTVPVLEVHGTKITTRFYQMLFERHPELLNIFNHANQKQGRQQTALANSVYAAAVHIDRLEEIIPVVKQIGHKHRSLGVKAEHYPIVGETLLDAMVDVLGDAATDEILAAWGEAYGVIANAFIGVEKEMYEEAENQDGGWADFREFVVAKKVVESDVITSFYLQPYDGGKIAEFKAGQYVTIKVKPEESEYTHLRQYSLSDASGKDYYRISVKHENDGVVSSYLHEKVVEGDKVELTAPAGDFVLNTDSDKPVVLIGGGVGVTPMMSMLNTLVEAQPEREVIFIHAAENGALQAFGEHVEELAGANRQVKNYVVYANPTEADVERGAFDLKGLIDLKWLKAAAGDVAAEADFYFCGPVPFMRVMKQYLAEMGVSDEHVHYEFFGPAASLEAAVEAK
ncbi:NO-inducible flavohemoprotein [Alkalihalophilus marmarensis]|uniref:Flavohemoprotein n=1 Tax=Alkalihalophilus marmarensis DSM 21297 TaxID=1188261 RepID=U6SMM3_9BACI|nr:NO-inducible flavohemoprotein [Alkalihalophilus marmarensis]ERN51871.1 dihydropteridine reductase [Alkalihalophilus marmarensis DSM 21297]